MYARIVLQTVINEFIINYRDRLDDFFYRLLWGGGWSGSDELWDDMIPVASALAALLSVILVARIAYRSMVLEEKLDIMKLWKPIAISFVLANWFLVTFSIYALVQPVEDIFRNMFETRNIEIMALQQRRLDVMEDFTRKTMEKAAIARAGDIVEEEAFHTQEQEELLDSDYGGAEEEEDDELISKFGEVYLDMEDTPLDDEGNPLPKIDATEEVRVAQTQNFIERVILWTAEAIWAVAVLTLFLVRALFLVILIIFGPVHMAMSVLPQWEDAWKDWLEKYIWANFLGTAAYLTLFFTLIIIQWGVSTDVANYQMFVADDLAWYDWLGHVMKCFAGSIGLYVVSLFIGVQAIPLAFELATYIFPSQGVHAASEFFASLWNTGKQGGYIVTGHAVNTTQVTAKAAGATYNSWQAGKQQDKAEDSLDMKAEMGPEGKMTGNEKTGESNNAPNTYDDHRQSATGTMENTETAAHRWADRMWQEKTASYGARAKHSDMRLKAAQQDLDEFFKAQQQGKGRQFMKKYAERQQDNKWLMGILQSGKVSLALFNGSKKQRNRFLKRHGLLEAFNRAERMRKQAENMKVTGKYDKKVQNARTDAADNIDQLIVQKVRNILSARGINPDVRFDAGNPDFFSKSTYRMKQSDEGFDKVNEQMKKEWFKKMTATEKDMAMLSATLQAYEKAVHQGWGDTFIEQFSDLGEAIPDKSPDDNMDPFESGMTGEEYQEMWKDVKDKEMFRKINEALDALEKATQKNKNT